MQDLLSKIDTAKADSAALDALLSEYLPFIRQVAGKQAVLGIEYDDCVSIGMLTFADCVRQYQPERGNFLSYCTVCIRNRLIDESRRQLRAVQNNVPLEVEEDDNNLVSFQDKAAIRAHARAKERDAMAEEIALLASQLREYRVRFDDLDRTCPKHSRLREQCIQAAIALAQDPAQARRLQESKRLPITYLADRFDIPVKTLEKFRKYLIAVAVIYMGDYPHVREFIPMQERNEV